MYNELKWKFRQAQRTAQRTTPFFAHYHGNLGDFMSHVCVGNPDSANVETKGFLTKAG
jgi:hypothetical protein